MGILEAFAKKLSDKKIYLSFKPGYPLAALQTSIIVDYIDNEYIEKDIKFVELKNELSNKLEVELKFYRNDVRPVLTEMVDYVTKQLSSHLNYNPISDMNIKEMVVFDSLISGSLGEEINNLPNVVDFTGNITLPDIDPSTVKDNILSIVDDEEIELYIKSMDISEIQRLYMDYLKVIGKGNSKYMFNSFRIIDIPNLTVIYLMLQYYKRIIPDGVRATSSKYETNLNIAISIIGLSLSNLVSRYRNMSNLNMIIIYTDTNNKTIYVNPAIYRGWVSKSDNTPDILLGTLLIDTPNSVTIDYIEDKKEILKSAVDSYIASYKRRKLHDIRNLYRTSLYYGFKITFKNLTDIEKDFISNDPSYLNNILSKVEKYIDTVKLDSISAFEETLKRDVYYIINNIRFWFTNANVFFKYLDIIIKENTNMNIKEAVGITAIKILIANIVSNVSIEYGNK